MLFLVLTHWDMCRLIEEYIRSHQCRISVKPHSRVVPVLARLLLKLGHAVEPSKARNTVENPSKLSVSRHSALIEYYVALGIDTCGHKPSRHFPRIGAQLTWILRRGNGMQIDYTINTVILVLKARPVSNCAKIIPQVQVASGLNAGKYTVHDFPVESSHCRRCIVPVGIGQSSIRPSFHIKHKTT